jgi:hypothetical protein
VHVLIGNVLSILGYAPLRIFGTLLNLGFFKEFYIFKLFEDGDFIQPFRKSQHNQKDRHQTQFCKYLNPAITSKKEFGEQK